jgi:hypothetical protein
MNLVTWLNLLHFTMVPFQESAFGKWTKHNQCLGNNLRLYSDRELSDSVTKTAIIEGGEFNELHSLMMEVHTCPAHKDWVRVKAEQKLQAFLKPRGISYEPTFIGPRYR